MAMAIVVIMTIGIITLLVLTTVPVFVLSVVFLLLVLLFLNLLLHFFFSFLPSSLGLFPASQIRAPRQGSGDELRAPSPCDWCAFRR